MVGSETSSVKKNEYLVMIKITITQWVKTVIKYHRQGSLPTYLGVFIVLLNTFLFSWTGYEFYQLLTFTLILIMFLSKYWSREGTSLLYRFYSLLGIVAVFSFIVLDVLMSYLFLYYEGLDFSILVILGLDIMMFMSITLWLIMNFNSRKRNKITTN